MNLITKLLEALGPVNENRQIICNDSGFTIVEHGNTLAGASWSEVLEIYAYKQDLFTTDETCLGFRVYEDGTSMMVSEAFVGYRELLTELERRFPGIRTKWLAEYNFPAFVPNRTTLWGQKWQQSRT
jgi:hypothetical protein